MGRSRLPPRGPRSVEQVDELRGSDADVADDVGPGDDRRREMPHDDGVRGHLSDPLRSGRYRASVLDRRRKSGPGVEESPQVGQEVCLHAGQPAGYSIRDGRYRYVEWVRGFKTCLPFDEGQIVGCEFYDYGTDPLETRNAVKDPEYRGRIERMRGALRRFYAEQYASPMSAPIARMLEAAGNR